MNIFTLALLASIGINLIMFIPAYLLQTDTLTDISYAVTFATVAVAGYLKSARTHMQLIILIMVLAWAVRLGTFLLIRIRKIKKDARFDGMRNRFFAFLRFWILQGATVYVVMLAAVLAWSHATVVTGVYGWVGLGVFATGLVLEASADMQKFMFNNHKTKDVWIDTGVWRMSRHPNYLGEMMVWSGMYIFVLGSLNFLGRYIGLLSPLYIITLLLFVSGVPLLEKSAEKKWGKLKEYKQYKKEVPVLLPTPSSIMRLLSDNQ